MDSGKKSPRKVLLDWYADQRPLTIDIVGDFAGNELFLIHGESLIRHCLAQSKVDFNEGFQLLHAVYAVEYFLQNLRTRGCNFNIVFLCDTAHLCAPAGVIDDNIYKYQLARAILIKHLSRSGTECRVFEFDSFEDEAFDSYLSTQPIQFALCHDGEEEGKKVQRVHLRHLVAKFINAGKSVAIINTVMWKSSKVFAPLMSGLKSSLAWIHDPDLHAKLDGDPLDIMSLKDFNLKIFDASCLSIKEWVTVVACRKLLTKNSPNKMLEEHVQALLLHTAILSAYSLGERTSMKAYQQTCLSSKEDQAFLCSFAQPSWALIESGSLSHDRTEDMHWDLFDLVDGRLFFGLVRALQTKEAQPEYIIEKGQMLWQAVTSGIYTPSLPNFGVEITQQYSNVDIPAAMPLEEPSILTFDHPVVNGYLKDVKVQETPEIVDLTAQKVFEDLHHWHVLKNVNKRDKPPTMGFFALRRNQRYMADIISYAASLSNSRGKILERETVVVSPKNRPQTAYSREEPAKNHVSSKNSDKQGTQKGGRQNALRAAQELQVKKAQDKREAILNHWTSTCVEIQRDSTLVEQYLKADKFLSTRSREDCMILTPDVLLFLCHVLSQIWTRSRRDNTSSGLHLIAMMWRWIHKIATSASLTRELSQVADRLAKAIMMPPLALPMQGTNRALPFFVDLEVARKLARQLPGLVDDARVLQITHGGPYMDRRFDSRPDDRVSFEPDAWQRKVLDSIDANESLLVVAPTSAGKTFVSFYAMKQALQESDDAVLVYVAPTKALVNQIAAEIEARFSKTYNGKEGRSVWAIHTRDYRINNPTGCQILVTVPHILQIMLLSPANATGPHPWSKRVKRIIFDEVHCIGQAEDGVIWEQLLLLAPCPIIALSATVANPEEFKDWLASAQANKGFKMTMIIHTARYSDLRKFIYKPSRDSKFRGLDSTLQLPVPGLDEGESTCPRFHFVHPVAALRDSNSAVLADISIEPRDCFSLWQKMVETSPPGLLDKIKRLDPRNVLPKMVTKSDVLQWERDLKSLLKEMMELPGSPFHHLQARLTPIAQENPSTQPSEGGHISTLFSLACDLHAQDALPAIVFSYDRLQCEQAVQSVLLKLEAAEEKWKASDSEWLGKMRRFEQWKRTKIQSQRAKASSRRKSDPDGELGMSKLDIAREEASKEISAWESFDPQAPSDKFSFADQTKVQKSEFDDLIQRVDREKIKPELIKGLRRGLGVHHAGLNRRYRQLVEVLFRKCYLRLVVATGTLALGINMPCKTVVFSGDSVFLTAQNYRQASGRAGRRGFDLLGNVVFNGIPESRVHEIMSSRLPDLRGQFPISTTLILRLFSLLNGTGKSAFAVDAFEALLSQTRLYLGGPESEMSVKHHLRFSIEYLRRQNLLSAEGEPLNFAGLVGHLYFTENAVFAFHSLLRGGYFHELCRDIDKSPKAILLEIMLVLCHLFNRVPIRRTKKLVNDTHRSSSMVFLPRLPESAESMLVRHNQETFSIFKDYVQSYINQHLRQQPDNLLPFTKTQVGKNKNTTDVTKSTAIRSPFVALSGFTDNFSSIRELCQTVRNGVFLEESAIPYIPIWPHDTEIEFNAYIYDFYKHGSMEVLVRDNKIKAGDVWFHLKDFYLTLKTIVTSIKGVVKSNDGMPDLTDDAVDMEDEGDCSDDQEELPPHPVVSDQVKSTTMEIKIKKKEQVLDSWEDVSESSEPESGTSSSEGEETTLVAMVDGVDREGGLMNVLKAFEMLAEQFDATFKKVWA